jgi:hypothetical protein
MCVRLILLTGSFEAKILMPLLADGQVEVTHIQSLEEWPKDADPQSTRLLAFCTAVIVPDERLSALAGPSYNIHPGPPCYPGRHPESWAAYDRAERFGATLHQMSARVDEGPIVDVKWVDAPPGGGQIEYGVQSFRASIDLLVRWRRHLLDVRKPLPVRPDLKWSGPKRTHAQLVAMRNIGPAIDAREFTRRRLSFAQIPGTELKLQLHGYSFVCVTPDPEAPTG